MPCDSIVFRRASDFADPGHLIALASLWVLTAGNPFYDWLTGGRQQSRCFVQACMANPSSELAVRNAELLTKDSNIIGGYIALSGRDLKQARMANIATLWGYLEAESRAALIQRLTESTKLFLPVDDDEYYLSKMGVEPAYRGRGLGRALVQRFLQKSKDLGYTRCRLDVGSTNAAAIQCYQAAGFNIVYTAQTPDGAIEYHAMTYEDPGRT
jgi:ribosomal protein S18 acetylase RimI-like enzyme